MKFNGFQKDVLTVINGIPFGEVRTYGQLATLLHKPGAARAVGTALAQEPAAHSYPLPPRRRLQRASYRLSRQQGYRNKAMAFRKGRSQDCRPKIGLNFSSLDSYGVLPSCGSRSLYREVGPFTLVFFRVLFATSGFVVYFFVLRRKLNSALPGGFTSLSDSLM